MIKPRDTKSYKEFLGNIKDKEKELQSGSPIPDLEALVSESTAAIYKVTVDSRKMKGTLVKLAKTAAADMYAAATIVAIKAQNPAAVPVYKQVETLHGQVQHLRMENSQLKQALAKAQTKRREQYLSAKAAKREIEWERLSETPLPSSDGENDEDEKFHERPISAKGPKKASNYTHGPSRSQAAETARIQQKEVERGGPQTMEVEEDNTEVTTEAISLKEDLSETGPRSRQGQDRHTQEPAMYIQAEGE